MASGALGTQPATGHVCLQQCAVQVLGDWEWLLAASRPSPAPLPTSRSPTADPDPGADAACASLLTPLPPRPLPFPSSVLGKRPLSNKENAWRAGTRRSSAEFPPSRPPTVLLPSHTCPVATLGWDPPAPAQEEGSARRTKRHRVPLNAGEMFYKRTLFSLSDSADSIVTSSVDNTVTLGKTFQPL